LSTERWSSQALRLTTKPRLRADVVGERGVVGEHRLLPTDHLVDLV
jgi:hypothetical protein